MKNWQYISGTAIAAAAFMFYNNDFKLSAGIITFTLIAIVFSFANRNKS